MRPASVSKRSFVLFGSHGSLGKALSQRLEASRFEWTALDHHSAPTLPPGSNVIFAGGLTDPTLPEFALLEANYDFPRRVMEQKTRGCRYLTLGTVFETIPESHSRNAYFRSKVKLAEWVRSSRLNVLHVRLHTLYGGALAPHMFLGQLAHALRTNTAFPMSAGEQLREYHHVEDVAGRVLELFNEEWRDPFLTLSHGKALPLLEIAQTVARDLKQEKLILPGVLPYSSGEIFKIKTTPSVSGEVRDPLNGIREWMRNQIAGV